MVPLLTRIADLEDTVVALEAMVVNQRLITDSLTQRIVHLESALLEQQAKF